MKAEINNEHLDILIDALKVWIQNYEARGFGPEHVVIAGNMIIALNKAAAQVIDKDPESEEQKHPEFTRGPNPGEHFELGKGYVPNKK